jgi:hypothetical protein
MAMDLPPPVKYHIERPAPSADRAAFEAISNSARAVAQRVRDAITPEPSPIDRALPPLDYRSPALTREDRVALVGSMQANRLNRLSQGVDAPQSYVGDRIRLAVAYAKAQDAIARGDTDSVEIRAARCRMVAVALDRRAGQYVNGGEQAASTARASLSKDTVEACHDAMRRASASRKVAGVREPTSVLPEARHAEKAPVRLALNQAPAVRVDLPRPERVRIDPRPSERVRIDPKGTERVRIDPVLRSQASGFSR